MIESIEQGRKEDGNRSIADKIIKRLHDLNKTVENNQGRWAWELLQNAKDSIAEEQDRTVSVQIELNQESVEFRHNGTHFTERDIRGLINQISSKEIEEGQHTKKTGRFGTGFLTTHLLSKVIQIKGIVQTANNDFYSFAFPLDRKGKTTTELVPKIENAWSEFHKSAQKIEHNYDESSFNTAFCYKLETESQRLIAKIGIEEFSKLIPFVLAFIPKISRVEVIDNTTERNSIFERKNNLLFDGLVIPILRTENQKEDEIFILFSSKNKVAIAAELEKIENGYSVKSNKNIPKIFCDFPLIGTENFYFPVIANSFFFNPKTERDGIWLKGSDDLEVKENQEILECAVALYKSLVSQISEQSFFDLYNLVETKKPDTNEKYFDDNWYKYSIQTPLRAFILEAKIVETQSGKVSLNQVYFPDPNLSPENREKIWQFSSDLKVNKLPLKQHIHKWAGLIWTECKKVDIADLVIDLNNTKNISNLINTLGADEKQSFNWLNNCIEFIYKIGGQIHFNNNKLIPNQNGIFKNRKELALDEIDDDVIKEVALLAGHNYYEYLINQNVFFEDCFSKVGLQDAANKITEQLNIDSININEDTKSAIRMLTEWFEHNEEKGKTLFASLYRKKEKLLVDTISDRDSLYSLLKGKRPLSELVDISNKIDIKLMQQATELDNLLKEFNVADVSELKEILLAKNTLIKNSKILINQDTLISLGITSLEELEKALEDKNFSEQFTHTSTSTVEMFLFAQKLIKRAKNRVIDHLKTLSNYNCDDLEESAPTVIAGVKKEGRPIYIVVRPSDNKQVIIYYSSEKDTLDSEDSELWIDNGKDAPKHLTLGKILKTTGITKIPV